MAKAPDGEIKVSVRGLWKLFDYKGGEVLPEEMEGLNKAELREQFGVVQALRDVSFDVQEGETFVVMGLSGSGKSTLVRTLVRLIEPTFGQIVIDGEDVLQYSEDQLIEFRRKKAAMVFQHFGLLPHRTVEENAAWGLEIQGTPRGDRLERAREVLGMVGLSGWERYRPGALSGGMQQRVGLARAVAADPDILLMDEPFSGLDPLIRRDMQNELVRLNEQLKKTIVFITHDLSEALKLGTHIAIMRDGEVIQLGTPEEILSNPADGYVEEFVRDVRRTSVVTLGSLMRRVPVKIASSSSPKEAMDAMSQAAAVAGFVVDAKGVYLGVLSFPDAAAASQDGKESVSDAVTTEDCPCLSADASIEATLPLVQNEEGVLPVVDEDNKLVGVIDASQVVKALADEVEETQAHDAEQTQNGVASSVTRAASV